jgi:NAD(P)-dependent dehydrogenase (short-subunit alcohol dehydrogenase family)
VDAGSAFSLAGQTAVITGGGSGLGLGTARCFVAAGARVVLVGRREEALRAAVAELGPAAVYETGDVSRIDGLAGLAARIEAHSGPVSILVNNAGSNLKKPALETTPADMEAMFRTHVLGAYELSRLFGCGMAERGGGTILFIASMASFLAIPLVAAYTVAKSGIVGVVRALTAELSPRGVRINAIAPGWIETDMLRAALRGDAARGTRILSRTPLGRFGDVSDIGWAAVYLASPAGRFVTGTVLPVDGGASVGF